MAIPDLSLIVPCYNEEDCLEITIPPLAEAFSAAGISLQLVLVDNGSKDRTSGVIQRLIDSGLPVTAGKVPVNVGQGQGFLSGIPLAAGKFVGWICADGQIEPDGVVKIYQELAKAAVPTLVKCRRLYRPDGLIRKIVSVGFNGLMHLFFPGIHCLDVNGNPKIMPAEVIRLMELSSKDWFLEAECMIKARYIKLPVIEIDLHGCLRAGGTSHVKAATVFEFAANIIKCRFDNPWRVWCKRMDEASQSRISHATGQPPVS